MTIPTYTLGYPPDGTSLGQTKSTIRNNLDGTFLNMSVDHQDQNEPNPGYHETIHEVTQGTATTISDINQVFSGIPGTLSVNSVTTPNIPPSSDTQLYSLSGMGVLSQLTGGVLANNGYAWVGGILIQWGFLNTNVGSTSTPLLFATANVDFPNSCFNVQVTPINRPTAPGGIGISNISKTGFSYAFAQTSGFNWIAIGN